ncbi:hypothetical protein EVAR_69655_1 [Eumeta japonica]|uniref:Uncharacterized protein n=1 Tax=Eumeta variegata TaxID=151549 RepID=A0A4C2A2M8_EUMVA|nr:hypothetical protein EVAR_69655_1 [Eumeta japonica]
MDTGQPFDRRPQTDNHQEGKNKLNINKETQIPTARQRGPVYMAIVVGVRPRWSSLLAVAIFLIVHRHRHRKCFASPLARPPSLRATRLRKLQPVRPALSHIDAAGGQAEQRLRARHQTGRVPGTLPGAQICPLLQLQHCAVGNEGFSQGLEPRFIR